MGTSSGLSRTFTSHCPIDFLILYFHGLPNPFSRNLFPFISIQNPPGFLGGPFFKAANKAAALFDMATYERFGIHAILSRRRATIGSSSARTSPFHEHIRMPPDGTRRSGRISKQVAINLFGSDMEGRVFSERTKTVVLSRYGAGIVSSYKLSAEQELVIRSEASRRETEARVVGQIGSEGNTYIYGIAFLDRAINFWNIDFPDLSDTEKLASKTLLECCSCQSREMADHSDLASDVMAVNDSIMRYCQKCGSSTLWKQAAPGSTPSSGPEEQPRPSSPTLAESFASPSRPPILDVKELEAKEGDVTERGVSERQVKERTRSFAGAAWREAETSTVAATLENRRKHVRTRVNFKACVRRPGLADDVVACEDMSRGGLRFKSNRKYFEKMLIEVAVPYSPGDQAIFVPAQIAYVQELPEQNTYRCGVMYLRSSAR